MTCVHSNNDIITSRLFFVRDFFLPTTIFVIDFISVLFVNKCHLCLNEKKASVHFYFVTRKYTVHLPIYCHPALSFSYVPLTQSNKPCLHSSRRLVHITHGDPSLFPDMVLLAQLIMFYLTATCIPFDVTILCKCCT